MNTKRTVFNMPSLYKPRITSNWLLGFVEGEGCFSVRKKDYMLVFSITQSSKDSALIGSIIDFIYDLPQIGPNNISRNSIALPGESIGVPKRNPSGIRIETQDIPGKTSVIRLVITQQELIKKVIIPFFDNLSWKSKKEKDYCDWKAVVNLRNRGHHYTEQDIKILNLILNQMNRNRLSTSQLTTWVNREQLNDEIDRLLKEPSNLEIKEGKIFIKSLNKNIPFSTRNYEKFKHAVQVLDAETGCVLYNFKSTRSCAEFVGLASSSAARYLKLGKRFLFQNKLVYIIKLDDTVEGI